MIFSVLSSHNPTRMMLVDGELCLSYGQVIERIEIAARWLAAEGVVPGDRVVLQLQKSANEIVLLYAIARLGAVFVNVHPLWSDDQLHYVLETSGAKIAVVEAGRQKTLEKTEGLKVFVGTETKDCPDFPWSKVAVGDRVDLQPTQADPDSLAAIIFTSGSTGKPKGVMHTHRNLVEFGVNVVAYLENTQDDRVLSVLPLSFGYGLSQLLTVAQVGASLFLQKSALAADVLDALEVHAITGLGAVPMLWRQMVEIQRQRRSEFRSLRYITNAGDTPGEQLVDDLTACFPGVAIVLMYGTTETLRSAYLPSNEIGRKKGAIGYAVPGVKLYILTDDGKLGGPGDRGVLLHGGAQIMLGYWNDPIATAEKLIRYPLLVGHDALLCSTEDRVRMDVDGCLWFEGRAAWMIKRNGFRVSLAEVEAWVVKLSAVKACAAFRGSYTNQGEEIHLVVIAKANGPFNSKLLLQVLRRNLPSYMLPKSISFWHESEFPHTPNGKVDRMKIETSERSGLSLFK